MTGNHAPKIPENLKGKGLLTGRASFEDTKRGTGLGNIWMMNIRPMFSRGNSKWTPPVGSITNSDGGYFAFRVKPDEYTFKGVSFSPGFSRPLIQSMSVCCYDDFARLPVAAGEIVYIGDLHFKITTKPKKEQLKEALHTGPLAPILVVGAIFGDDDYLQIEVMDRYDEAVKHFSESGTLKDRKIVKKLLSETSVPVRAN